MAFFTPYTATATDLPKGYNNGQVAEQVARLNRLGYTCKADNRPAWAGGDIGDLQVKSERATVSESLDLVAWLAADRATQYAFVLADLSGDYTLDPLEWLEFVLEFHTFDINSKTKAGKVRLKHESRAMRAWLASHAR